MIESLGARYFGMLARVILSLSAGVADQGCRAVRADVRLAAPAGRRAVSAAGSRVRRPPAALVIEATACDVPEGLEVTVDGWCLVNADVVWLRFTIDDVVRAVSLGQPRPDVHDVMNRQGFYHPLNALCSGLRDTLLYDGVRSQGGQCAVRIEVVLASGVVVQAPTPKTLTVNETVTLAQ